MSRPWEPERKGDFWWFSLAAEDGRHLGMFMRQSELVPWIDRHPGRRWRVGLWRGGGRIAEWLVWARPGMPGRPGWRGIESRAERRRKGGGDGSGE